MPQITLISPYQEPPLELQYQTAGNTFTLTWQEAVYKGSYTLTGPGAGWLQWDGRIIPFYLSIQQDQLQIWVNGQTYTVQHQNKAARRSDHAGGGAAGVSNGEIKAPMPGTVLKVLVQVGDFVDTNQPLVIMESMKMEMTLSAPQAGQVSEVLCQVGQLVEMGARLIQVKETSTSPSDQSALNPEE